MNSIKAIIAACALLFSSYSLAENWQGQPQKENFRSSMNDKQSADKTKLARTDISKKQIRTIQQNLNDDGYSLAVDGILGKQTTKAVKQYQLDNNLVANGDFTPETLKALGVENQDQNRDRTRRPASVNGSEPLETEKDSHQFDEKMKEKDSKSMEVYPEDENEDMTTDPMETF